MISNYSILHVTYLIFICIFLAGTISGQVVPTNEWISLYSEYSTLDGDPLAVGTNVTVYDPDDVLCGEIQVTETGKFGFLQVYRDDPTTPQSDEGAQPGDSLRIFVNGYRAISQAPVFWLQKGQITELFLSAFSSWPPEISGLSGQTIDEGENFLPLFLDNYVVDPDDNDASLIWSVSGHDQLTISVENHILLVIVPDQNWFGSETFRLIVTDPDGLRDTAFVSYTVTAVNDAPQIANIPNQSINEGEAYQPVNLSLYATDVDNTIESLVWSASGFTQLNVSVTGSVLTVTVPDQNWFGDETVRLIVMDPGGRRDTAFVNYTVTAVNDPPIISSISNQTILEGDIFTPIYLPDFVHDPDDSTEMLNWKVNCPEALNCFLYNSLLTITPADSEWSGNASIKLIVTDPGKLADSLDIIFSVIAVNDAPTIAKIPDQKIEEGDKFNPVNLELIVFDPDDSFADLVWSSSGGININVVINGQYVWFNILDENWYGIEQIILKVMDPGGLFAVDTINLEVFPENDGPQILEIPQISFQEDDTIYIPVDYYYPFIFDADNEMEELNLSILSGRHTEVRIEKNHFRFLADTNWFGTDTLIFLVNDGFESDSSDLFVFVNSVNDPPQINLPDSVNFCDTIPSFLYVDKCIYDVESPDTSLVVLVSSGNEEVQIDYQKSDCRIYFDFNNLPTVEFVLNITVIDDSLAMASDSTIIIYKEDVSILKHAHASSNNYSLEQNYPNPFNPSTTIVYGLEKPGQVKLTVYNLLGEVVNTLVNGRKQAGSYTVQWQPTNLASGVYMYKLETIDRVEIKKMVFIK